MKLHELANMIGKGNATSLTGGPLPNAYTDSVSDVSKKPRKKKKDVYGVGVGVSNYSGNGDMGGSEGGASSGDGGGATAGATAGGSTGGTGGGSGGSGGAGGGGGGAA